MIIKKINMTSARPAFSLENSSHRPNLPTVAGGSEVKPAKIFEF
jgi:hypothetical protein